MADEHNGAAVPLGKIGQGVQHGAHGVGPVHIHTGAQVALDRVKHQQGRRAQRGLAFQPGVVQGQPGAGAAQALHKHAVKVCAKALQSRAHNRVGVVFLGEIPDIAGRAGRAFGSKRQRLPA